MHDKNNISDIIDKLQIKKPDILTDYQYNQYAVLLPLIMHKNELSVLFEVRSKHLKGQPGEICFPGGQMETIDISPEATAVRETSEEMGISKEDIKILGPLDVLWTPYQYKIHLFTAQIKENTLIKPLASEVEEVFYVPLDFLLNTTPITSEVHVKMKPDKTFPYHLIPGGQDYPWRSGKYPVYFYSYEQYVIWGITARILHHFLDTIKK